MLKDLDGLVESLTPIFDGFTPLFVSDSADLVRELNGLGIGASHFGHVEALTAAERSRAVIVAVDFSAVPSQDFLERNFGDSAALVLPVAAFSGDVEGALYLLEHLARIDFSSCVDGIHRILNVLESEEVLHFSGPETDLTVTLEDELCLMTPKDKVPLALREWVSVASYLEVGLVTPQERETPAYSMTGTFAATGVAVAHHRQLADEARAISNRTWNTLRQAYERNDGAPIILTLEDSHPTSITCGRDDLTQDVRDVVDPPGRRYIGELGIAATQLDENLTVNWAINSQFNEAIGGLHLGFGRGLTGPHIDFIAPDVKMKAG